ncbi:MAG TPA: hypothetical protein VMD02_03110 [Candidatus Omnitrophota bacterium]|nr:hypothetical protein [Candidatus Omnitrophota bacterium]
MSIGNIGSSGISGKSYPAGGANSPVDKDFMLELQSKFDNALSHLEERKDLPVNGVFSFNNNIYNTMNISHGGNTSVVV